MGGWAPGAFFLIALTLLDTIRSHGFNYHLFIHTCQFISSLDLSSKCQTLTTSYPLDLATSISSGLPNLTCPKLHFPSFLQSCSSQWTAILLFRFLEQKNPGHPWLLLHILHTIQEQFLLSLHTRDSEFNHISLPPTLLSQSIICAFFLFSAPLHSMQALSSFIRDQTHTPFSGSTKS